MKKNRNPDILPLGIVLLSAAGHALRSGLYAVALDEKNLLLRNHPLSICLWVCTAAAVALSLAAAAQGYRIKQYAANFSGSLLSALGHILAGSGILLTVLLEPAPILGPLSTVWKVSGMLSCAGLYWAAFSRTRGERPFFGTYALASLFFAIHLVSNYRQWCSDPQLQNYVFAFLASMMLMVFAYDQTAFCVDSGSGFRQRLTGLLAAYFCLCAMAVQGSLWMYGGCALWAITGLSRIRPRKEKKAGDANAPA